MTDYNAIIRDHLTKQKARALNEINEIGGCVYKDSNGNKCAIGCLIPDHLYNPDMENMDVRDILNRLNIQDFDLFDAFEWQKYHDMQSKYSGLSYEEWLSGNEKHSPEAFYNYLQGNSK